jgi:predicted DNA-binding protein
MVDCILQGKKAMAITRNTTTIRIPNKLRDLLGNLKEHPRETYADVIKRIIEKGKGVGG